MDQRKEEEEEGSVLIEPTDHQREEEEDSSLLKEPTEQQREEEESSEEPACRRSEEPTETDARKEAEAVAERSSDEESEAASTLFVHPCSLLRYLVRAFACCLGMPDSFGGGTAKRSDAAPASVDSSRDVDVADRNTGVTGFYMQEVITRVFAVRRPRPPSGNPREGSGGNGGHHH